MPRPHKRRMVCALPRCTRFWPEGSQRGDTVKMAIDEYETIRLIDLEGLTQEQCANQMGIARTTVQSIYTSARKKLAKCIVGVLPLIIEGGEYSVCEYGNGQCGRGCCKRLMLRKGERKMKIAVTYENGSVFQHFGHTEKFKVYGIENGKITEQMVIDTNGNGHGALAEMLKDNGVDTLICGGIGGGAKRALAEMGIALYGGVSGDADKAVNDLISNRLSFDSDAECDHHGTSCGEHDETCHH